MEALYQKWHKDGLEIVGINFDPNAETGPMKCKSLGITYPQVWVPSDGKQRELWQTASAISSFPRVLVIGRDGILHADDPKDVEQELAKLLASPR